MLEQAIDVFMSAVALLAFGVVAGVIVAGTALAVQLGRNVRRRIEGKPIKPIRWR